MLQAVQVKPDVKHLVEYHLNIQFGAEVRSDFRLVIWPVLTHGIAPGLTLAESVLIFMERASERTCRGHYPYHTTCPPHAQQVPQTMITIYQEKDGER